MTQLKSPRQDEGDLFCLKCDRHLARLIDGVLVAGGIRLYGQGANGQLKYFCASCGRGYTFRESPPPKDEAMPETTYKIVNELGKDYSESWLYKRERQKNKTLDALSEDEKNE
jgi:hypothetical protein